jgi:hypothetical protein
MSTNSIAMEQNATCRFSCFVSKHEPKELNLINSTPFARITLILMVFLISASLHAQEVRELEGYLEQMRTSTDSASVANAALIESLVTDLHATVYIDNSITANGDTPPVVAVAKAASVSKLILTDSRFTQVEFITIKLSSINDLNIFMDINKFVGFTNLKYVYFLCEFECTPDALQKLFLPKTGIMVFYKISIAS